MSRIREQQLLKDTDEDHLGKSAFKCDFAPGLHAKCTIVFPSFLKE